MREGSSDEMDLKQDGPLDRSSASPHNDAADDL
jgi:hypothetical protein